MNKNTPEKKRLAQQWFFSLLVHAIVLLVGSCQPENSCRRDAFQASTATINHQSMLTA
ncbi:MAG TPA: hypothetical protein PLF92_09665 [Arenimonas sp.]|nr:hypothetical protein [Arenimonas sp.]